LRATGKGRAMTDYWLSKLIYDLQQPALGAEYRADRASVMERYALKPGIKAALLADDVSVIAPLVNAYLLRYYFSIIGMPDDAFIGRLRALTITPS
jgi:hypothetical protein